MYRYVAPSTNKSMRFIHPSITKLAVGLELFVGIAEWNAELLRGLEGCCCVVVRDGVGGVYDFYSIQLTNSVITITAAAQEPPPAPAGRDGRGGRVLVTRSKEGRRGWRGWGGRWF